MTVWSNKAYSEDVAEYSTSMVADGRLSMTHDRPANFNEITAWATYSPTGDNLSIGQPDCLSLPQIQSVTMIWMEIRMVGILGQKDR